MAIPMEGASIGSKTINRNLPITMNQYLFKLLSRAQTSVLYNGTDLTDGMSHFTTTLLLLFLTAFSMPPILFNMSPTQGSSASFINSSSTSIYSPQLSLSPSSHLTQFCFSSYMQSNLQSNLLSDLHPEHPLWYNLS